MVRELGCGGMGVVYLVRDRLLRGKEFALKAISPTLVDHPEARDRFVREVLAAQELAHESIIRVFGLDEEAGQPFFTMDYVPGRSLRELMEERKKESRTFSLEEANKIMQPVLSALEYAHSRRPIVVHRDVKPENIMVTGEFPDIQVKVLDFGLAKILSPSRFTSSVMSMGTAYYMSPEQLGGKAEVDERSDIFSTGVVLYELLTGKIPSGRFKLPSEIISGLPVALDEVVDKVLQPEPSDRFQSALEMSQGLEEVLPKEQQKEIPAPGDTWTEPVTGMEFVWVPGGTFMMGSPEDEELRDVDEGPVHEVELDGFWLGKYEVMQGEWVKVVGKNPSEFKKGDRYPVETVSWIDAKSFIKKLTSLNRSRFEFRLPTEAEWEYACRAGTRTPFYFGNTINTDQANYNGADFPYGKGTRGVRRNSTTPVGSFPANAFGLHDMHGNVFEWCEDVYADDTHGKYLRINPLHTGEDLRRVLRGGSWRFFAGSVRCAVRKWGHPNLGDNLLGLRLARKL
jgi:formylglycine-generating enzyme required for sulfatase activity/tRNA A-37 threonylcarbamoyl transferase component Bud32